MKSTLIALCAGAALTAGFATAAAAAPGYGQGHAQGHGYSQGRDYDGGRGHGQGQRYGHGQGYGHSPQGHPAYNAPRGPAWVSINQRQANLEQRIQQGLRYGGLSRHEAIRLRGEFRQIQYLEAHYRRGGLTRWEMADLDQRMDRLSARIYVERRDSERRYGQGYGYGSNPGYGYGYNGR